MHVVNVGSHRAHKRMLGHLELILQAFLSSLSEEMNLVLAKAGSTLNPGQSLLSLNCSCLKNKKGIYTSVNTFPSFTFFFFS